jgi:hypothetical protein
LPGFHPPASAGARHARDFSGGAAWEPFFPVIVSVPGPGPWQAQHRV